MEKQERNDEKRKSMRNRSRRSGEDRKTRRNGRRKDGEARTANEKWVKVECGEKLPWMLCW